MRINSISSSPQCSFGSFKVTGQGAQVLAEEFVKNPKLEYEFMLNIAKPLDEVSGDVVFDGRHTSFKHFQEDLPSSIIHTYGCDGSLLAIISENYSRQAYRKLTDVNTTNMFQDHYPLREIEAAKNIIMDKNRYYSEIAAAKYVESHVDETVEQKAERFQQKFGIDA